MKCEEERDEEWIATTHHNQNIVVRITLVVALSIALMGALNWAIHVTNANARQISFNLTHIEQHFGNPGGKGNAKQSETAGPILNPTQMR